MEFENSSPSLHTTQAHVCICPIILFPIDSVEFSCSVVSNSLWPHGLQHARLPCPSLTPGTCANLCPSSQWCHPTISSSFVPFSSYLQSFPASGSFQYINCIIWVRSVFSTYFVCWQICLLICILNSWFLFQFFVFPLVNNCLFSHCNYIYMCVYIYIYIYIVDTSLSSYCLKLCRSVGYFMCLMSLKTVT